MSSKPLAASRICGILGVRETRQWRFLMASFEQIEEYAEHHTRALSDSHARLWKETHEKTEHPGMMVGLLEGSLLRLLVRLTAAERVLEISVLTRHRGVAGGGGL